MDHTPAVLSVGTRCLEQGYSLVRPAGGKPIMVRPDNKAVKLQVDGHVPVLSDRCKVFNKKSFRKDKPFQELFAMANKGPRNSHEFAAASSDRAEGDPMDEGVPDEEDERYVRSRSTAELEREARSASHQFTRFPKGPFLTRCPRIPPAYNGGLITIKDVTSSFPATLPERVDTPPPEEDEPTHNNHPPRPASWLIDPPGFERASPVAKSRNPLPVMQDYTNGQPNHLDLRRRDELILTRPEVKLGDGNYYLTSKKLCDTSEGWFPASCVAAPSGPEADLDSNEKHR
eukprot:Skav227706  [mRNA]  locus=scaffold79:110716:112921:+ [translate_table: standard]